jgi:hypothetical protein
MADRWAFCDRCSRWFYAQREVLDSDEPRCPVCDSSASMVRDGEPEPTQSA